MHLFITTFIVSFLLLGCAGLLVTWAKRRQYRTSHGLTGMCHETGGRMCCSCSTAMGIETAQKHCQQPKPAEDKEKTQKTATRPGEDLH